MGDPDAIIGFKEFEISYLSNIQFIEDLRAGELRANFNLTGAVKAYEESKESFQFSVGLTREDWIEIPLSLVLDGSVRVVGEFPCKDHSHPIVTFSLAQPSSTDGAALYDLLKRTVSMAAIEPDIVTHDPNQWLMHMPPFNGLEIEGASPVEEMVSATAKAEILTYCSKMCATDPESPYYGSRVCCSFRRNSTGRWPNYDSLGCYKFGLCVLGPGAGKSSK
jgi:hypothetical protein